MVLFLLLIQETPDPNGPGLHPPRAIESRELGSAPARISSNHLLHSLFGILPMESALPLLPWRIEAGIWQDISSGKLDVVDDEYFFHYDATLLETNFEFRLGLPAGFEATIGFDLSDLLQDDGKIILERNPGDFLIEPGERGVGLGDVRFRLKKSILSNESRAFGIVAGVKIPVSTDREDLLTSEGVDIAASALFTQRWGPVTVHVNFGGVLPGRARVFGEEVETQPSVFFGASLVWKFEQWGAAILQFQGNQSVFQGSFDSVRILEDFVASVHLGGRFRIAGSFLEPTIGMGLTGRSSDFVATVGIVVPFGESSSGYTTPQ